jgi:hypothetical protein
MGKCLGGFEDYLEQRTHQMISRGDWMDIAANLRYAYSHCSMLTSLCTTISSICYGMARRRLLKPYPSVSVPYGRFGGSFSVPRASVKWLKHQTRRPTYRDIGGNLDNLGWHHVDHCWTAILRGLFRLLVQIYF